jgi:hypothetical protein
MASTNIQYYTGSTFNQTGNVVMSEAEILAEYSKIQSLHDRNKSLPFTDAELQIKALYKSIQSRKDIARLGALRQSKITADTIAMLEDIMDDVDLDEYDESEVDEYEYDEGEELDMALDVECGIIFSDAEIIAEYSKIQSRHDKNKLTIFTEGELQIKELYRSIQSRKDRLRLQALKESKIPTSTSAQPVCKKSVVTVPENSPNQFVISQEDARILAQAEDIRSNWLTAENEEVMKRAHEIERHQSVDKKRCKLIEDLRVLDEMHADEIRCQMDQHRVIRHQVMCDIATCLY